MEYLNGLTQAAQIVATALHLDAPVDYDRVLLTNAQIDLEGYIARCQQYTPYEAQTRPNHGLTESLVKRLGNYTREYRVTAPDEYTLKELEKISNRIGVIAPTEAKNLYEFGAAGAKTAYKIFGLEAAQRTLIAYANCDLLAQKLPNQKYKIIYCDTGKNYLRGADCSGPGAHGNH